LSATSAVGALALGVAAGRAESARRAPESELHAANDSASTPKQLTVRRRASGERAKCLSSPTG